MPFFLFVLFYSIYIYLLLFICFFKVHLVNIFGPICFGFFGPTFEAHYSYPFKKAKSWPFIFIKSSPSISNPKPHHFSLLLSSPAVLPIFFSFDFLSIPSSYLFFLPSQVFFLFLLFFFILFSFFSFYFLFV